MVSEVALGQRDIAQNSCQYVVEVMRNATGHGSDGLHFLRLTQFRFHDLALGFDAVTGREVTDKQRHDRALATLLDRQVHGYGKRSTGTGASLHLTHFRALAVRVACQCQRRVGQKSLKRAAQRLRRSAVEHRGGSRVEDGDVAAFVDADDRVKRRVDDGSEPLLALAQFMHCAKP